ncbi:carboxylate--amine ligase [Dermabacteraceae bacterium P7074]
MLNFLKRFSGPVEPFPGNPNAPCDVFLVGSDIGIYAMARAFYEKYGIVSTVVSRQVVGPCGNSRILNPVPLGPESSEEDIIDALVALGKQRGETAKPTLLMANADFLIVLLAKHRERLGRYFLLPILPDDTLSRVSDKAEFTQICNELDIPTPATVTVDFSDGLVPEPEIPFAFPVIAKCARSSAYTAVSFAGKKKVFLIDSPEELQELWQKLAAAGFRDRFVVQERIPGDDTAMLSLTAYCDRNQRVTMLGGARVLLEEHTPTALGNPAAMVTTDLGDTYEQGLKFLEKVNYLGFANFDIKIDPRDGVAKFFEVNPRIGRNNYYMTAAGLNIAEFVVADFVERRELELHKLNEELLYSIIPTPFLMRYLVDKDVREWVSKVAKHRTVHPLRNPLEGVRRSAYLAAATANQIKKFLTYYPKPTSDAF